MVAPQPGLSKAVMLKYAFKTREIIMKIAFKHQTETHKNNDACSATIYPIANAALDFAIVNINGRFQAMNRVTNTICQEIVYIQRGNGKVVINHETHELHAGDVVLIEPGDKYYWEGNMEVFACCTPPFTVQQREEVE